jgi:hypothetical protein
LQAALSMDLIDRDTNCSASVRFLASTALRAFLKAVLTEDRVAMLRSLLRAFTRILFFACLVFAKVLHLLYLLNLYVKYQLNMIVSSNDYITFVYIDQPLWEFLFFDCVFTDMHQFPLIVLRLDERSTIHILCG